MKVILTSAAIIFTGLALCGPAAAQSTADVTAACSAGTNLPTPVCDCIGEGSAEFSAQQREFMTAALSGNSDLANQIRTGMTVADLVAITNYIGNSPLECMQGG